MCVTLHPSQEPIPRSPMYAAPSPEPIMARAATENFPVASRLLPPRARRHLLAIYGFARLVDELGDEFPGDRLAAPKTCRTSSPTGSADRWQ